MPYGIIINKSFKKIFFMKVPNTNKDKKPINYILTDRFPYYTVDIHDIWTVINECLMENILII